MQCHCFPFPATFPIFFTGLLELIDNAPGTILKQLRLSWFTQRSSSSFSTRFETRYKSSRALSEKFRYLPSFWDFSQNLTKYNFKNHHYLHQDSRFMQFCCIPYSRSKPFQGRLHFLLSSARTPANTWGSIIG